jgi:hypothetical protein
VPVCPVISSAIHARETFSDKIGRSECVICAICAKAAFRLDAVDTLIAASFRQNRAKLRNVESGFDSRTRSNVFIGELTPTERFCGPNGRAGLVESAGDWPYLGEIVLIARV